ncbi:unnamed protein product [Strongylus vulgaris]|uniref:Uncharacterized protein n=1 Tax=Strongylus vulgaris TaxID=40348 RepID=A0A3P7JHV5_STRVU|nr:unnamed protein product [Strongylus vulgaris]
MEVKYETCAAVFTACSSFCCDQCCCQPFGVVANNAIKATNATWQIAQAVRVCVYRWLLLSRFERAGNIRTTTAGEGGIAYALSIA